MSLVQYESSSDSGSDDEGLKGAVNGVRKGVQSSTASVAMGKTRRIPNGVLGKAEDDVGDDDWKPFQDTPTIDKQPKFSDIKRGGIASFLPAPRRSGHADRKGKGRAVKESTVAELGANAIPKDMIKKETPNMETKMAMSMMDTKLGTSKKESSKKESKKIETMTESTKKESTSANKQNRPLMVPYSMSAQKRKRDAAFHAPKTHITQDPKGKTPSSATEDLADKPQASHVQEENDDDDDGFSFFSLDAVVGDHEKTKSAASALADEEEEEEDRVPSNAYATMSTSVYANATIHQTTPDMQPTQAEDTSRISDDMIRQMHGRRLPQGVQVNIQHIRQEDQLASEEERIRLEESAGSSSSTAHTYFQTGRLAKGNHNLQYLASMAKQQADYLSEKHAANRHKKRIAKQRYGF